MLPQNHIFLSMSRAGIPQLSTQYTLRHRAITSSTYARCWTGCREQSTALSASSNARSCCQASLVHQSSLGRSQSCPGGGGFPGLAECLLVEEKSMLSQGFLPCGWFIHLVAPGKRVTFTAVPGCVSCQHGVGLPGAMVCQSCSKLCGLQQHCPKRGAPPDQKQHDVFENTHSSLHRAATMYCKGYSLVSKGRTFLSAHLPAPTPATAQFMSLLGSLKHSKI